MSRPTPDYIPVKPTSDVYTALLAVAAVVTLAGLIIMFVKAGSLFPGKGLL